MREWWSHDSEGMKSGNMDDTEEEDNASSSSFSTHDGKVKMTSSKGRKKRRWKKNLLEYEHLASALTAVASADDEIHEEDEEVTDGEDSAT